MLTEVVPGVKDVPLVSCDKLAPDLLHVFWLLGVVKLEALSTIAASALVSHLFTCFRMFRYVDI